MTNEIISKNPCKWMILFSEDKSQPLRIELYANSEELFIKHISQKDPNEMVTVSGSPEDLANLKYWAESGVQTSIDIGDISFNSKEKEIYITYHGDVDGTLQMVSGTLEDQAAVAKFINSLD